MDPVNCYNLYFWLQIPLKWMFNKIVIFAQYLPNRGPKKGCKVLYPLKPICK